MWFGCVLYLEVSTRVHWNTGMVGRSTLRTLLMQRLHVPSSLFARAGCSVGGSASGANKDHEILSLRVSA